MNDPEGAAEALERAIALEPDRHTAYTQLFTARMQQKRPDLALAVAERMKTQFPDRISGDTLLGIAYLSTRDIDKAHEAFARAVEREPEDPEAAGNQIGRAACKGKSVSVRGELGGRQIIKKKTKKKPTKTNHK